MLWDPESDKKLLSLVGTKRYEDMLEDFPGYSRKAIAARVYRLRHSAGTEVVRPPHLWTPEEDAKLLELAPLKSFGRMEIEGDFPGKTRSSISGRYHRLVPKVDIPHAVTERSSEDSLRVGRKKKSKPIPVVEVEDICTKTLLELQRNDCRWIVDRLYCGEPIHFGSYCRRHAPRVYRCTLP